MEHLFELVSVTWQRFAGLELYYQIIVAGLALYIPLRRYFWPSWRILHLALFHAQPLGRLRALSELMYCLFYAQKTRSLFRAARLRVELELLIGRPASPLPCAKLTQRLSARWRYLKDLLAWRAEVNGLLSQLAEDSQGSGAQITVRTCFDLHKARERLAGYFTALAFVVPRKFQNTDRCVARVRIEQGFVAPVYLITGLLDRYDQDWHAVIDDFGREITAKNDILKDHELRRLQMFLFDCWLLWGPSIPVCQCDYWHGLSALQYGYGDENNSIPLYGEGLTKALGGLVARVQGEAHPPVAFQASVTCIPRWGPFMQESNFCVAQQGLCHLDAGLVLEFVRLDEIGSREEEVRRRYYSAYIWVMFVICDRLGEPLFQERPWRGLLPFYEHGNIADGKTYETLKQQLAHKVLSTLVSLSVAHAELRFRYVCAFDESLCGSGLTYTPPAPLLRTLLSDRATAMDNARLRESVLLDTASGWQDCSFSSCHLPALIGEYYNYVKAQA